MCTLMVEDMCHGSCGDRKLKGGQDVHEHFLCLRFYHATFSTFPQNKHTPDLIIGSHIANLNLM